MVGSVLLGAVDPEVDVASPGSALTEFSLQLQGACTVDETLNTYLGSIAELIPAESYALYRLDPSTGRPIDCAAHASEEFLAEYERVGRHDDPVLTAALQDEAPRDERLASAAVGRSWEDTGAYEVLGRAGLVHSLEAPVRVAGHIAGTLNFARTADQSPFTADDLRHAEHACRIVGMALQRAIRFDATERRAGLLTDVLDQLDTALLITNLDGERLFSNAAAELAVDASERPLVNAVAPAIREALTTLRQRRGERTASARHTLDLADHRAETGARSVRLGTGEEFVLTFLDYRPVDAADEAAPGAESKLPLLSPRELEVAELVARGLTTGEMSKELFISQNTVKQHLKRMFQKIEVNNRAQLVAALWSPETSGSSD